MNEPDLELAKTIFNASQKYYDEITAKYGDNKATILSEFANILNMVKVGIIPDVPSLLIAVDATIDLLLIDRTEAVAIIKRFQEIRLIETSTEQMH